MCETTNQAREYKNENPHANIRIQLPSRYNSLQIVCVLK